MFNLDTWIDSRDKALPSRRLPGWLSAKESDVLQETQVPSLGQEEPLEEDMATHCSILSWKVPWTEEPGGLQSMGSQRARHD